MNITRRNKKCLLIINDFHKLEPRYTAVACDGMRRPAFNCHYFIHIYIINWLYQFVVRKKKINLFLVNIMVMSTGFKTTNNGMVQYGKYYLSVTKNQENYTRLFLLVTCTSVRQRQYDSLYVLNEVLGQTFLLLKERYKKKQSSHE